ncbi:YgeY family selenium metabolism-linked hydrolase [Saccharopolyspora sp. NPDC002686]|uniref:YgeY family selenium metabolism-linked hydrolase n=1 Tax=Saccharopolyspora sp. NPDC002686 TaxID=3154541 RepID=UPI003319563B
MDEARIQEFLLRLLAARSYATEEAAAARVLGDELAAVGFTVDVDDWGNVIGTLRLGDGPTVLLDAHLDTVEVPDPAQWQHDPRGEVVDGVVYGRGAVDMKGALAAAVHGAAALRTEQRGTIVISGSVCEELVEGPALSRVVEQVRPDAVIICEPSANRLVLGQRGRAEVEIEVHGRTSHSAYPEAGVNAAEVMADVMTAVRQLRFGEHPDLGPGMIALTNLKSFPHPNVSMVPDRCVATYDRRTVLGEHDAGVLKPLRELADPIAVAAGARVDVRIATTEFTTYRGVPVEADSFAPAWWTDPATWPARDALTGLAAAGLDPTPGYYAFCTNGSASAGRCGIPTLGFGPGDPDRAHTVDESLSLEDLHRAARGYSALLRAVLTA